MRTIAFRLAVAYLLLATAIYANVLRGQTPLPVDLFGTSPVWGPEARVQGQSPNIGDLLLQIYPWRLQAAASLRDGVLPLWNPRILGGTPFVGNAQSAVFYPPNWLFALMPGPQAWGTSFILKTAAAGWFTALLICGLGGAPSAGFLGGVIFALSGFMTVWRGYPMGDVALWLPCAGYCTLLLVRERRVRWALAAAAAFAMSALAGHPETLFHLCIFNTAFFLFLCFTRAGAGQDRETAPVPTRTNVFLAYSSAAILGMGVAAVQLFPTLQWLAGTATSLGDSWPSPEMPAFLSLLSRDMSHAVNSAGIPIPEGAGYLGVSALMLAAFAFLYREFRVLAWFFMGVGIVSLDVIYGLGPSQWVVVHTPVLAGLKNWRVFFLVDFCAAILAGLGFSALLRSRLEVKRQIAAGFAALALAGAGLWRLARAEQAPPDLIHTASAGAAIAASVFLLAMLRSLNRMRPAVFRNAAMALALFDMGSFSLGATTFADGPHIYPPAPVFDFLRANMQPGDRVASIDDAIPENLPGIYGLDSLSGYDIPLRNVRSLLADLSEDAVGLRLSSKRVVDARDRRLDMMGVRYLVAATSNEGAAMLESQPERFVPVFSTASLRIFENRASLPRLAPIRASGIEVLGTEALRLARLHDAGFDPGATVLLERAPDFPADSPGSGDFQIHGLSVADQETRAVVDASEPAILVHNVIDAPGWSVYVDRESRPLLRANAVLQAVAVGAGSHEVIFRYEPGVFGRGLLTTALTLGLCALLYLTPWGQRPRSLAFGAGIVLMLIAWNGLALWQTVHPGPEQPVPASLTLDKREAEAGSGSYTITVQELPNTDVLIEYSFEGGAPETFRAHLDSAGQLRLGIGPETKKGHYRFTALKPMDRRLWTPIDPAVAIDIR